jgi:hypothetical protein
MAEVSWQDDRHVVLIHGLDALWSLRRRIVVPLQHVRGAHVDPYLQIEAPWVGAGRTDALLGWAVAAGPMLVSGDREFWDVHHPEKAIVIDLSGERFSRLVIEVDDPSATIDAVNAAVPRAVRMARAA